MSAGRVLLAVIVAAAALIRIPPLLHDGLWRDEAYVYVDAIAPTFAVFLHRVVETEYHPPLYFLLVYAWIKLAGASELSLKALPFLFSVLTVPVVYRLGKLAVSTGTGLLAAAMYAVSPVAVGESGDYLYPLMGLLCTLLASLVLSARRERLTWLRVAAMLAVTVAVTYTHYAALFYVPLLALWALTSPRGIRHGAAIAGVLWLGLASFLFWLPTFLSQHDAYLKAPSPEARVSFFFSTLAQSMPAWPLDLQVLTCVLAAGALVVALRTYGLNRDVAALALIFIVLLAIVACVGVLNLRYAAIFEGVFCVFLASLVAAAARTIAAPTGRRWAIGVATGLAALLVIEDATSAAHLSRVPKSGVRTFVAAGPLDPKTLYVVAPDFMTATFVYYARNEPVSYTAFVQTDHPEIFRFGDISAWRDPSAIGRAIRELDRKAKPYRYLDVVVDDNARGPQVRAFLRGLAALHPLLGQAAYAGRLEPITVYRFGTNFDRR